MSEPRSVSTIVPREATTMTPHPAPELLPADVDLVKRITDFLEEDLASVRAILRGTLDSDSRLIREVGEYISLSQGKMLRPTVVLLVARALAPERPLPHGIAAAMELIHVATLVHDDVIDRAETRRGRPSVNARWGDDVAILMADYLYAHAFDLALAALDPGVMRVVTRVTRMMCEGEMFQIEWRDRELGPEDYFRVVERKTGRLFSACAALGAMHARRPEREVAAAADFGLDFGVAFQITDDTLDFTATDERWGKDTGMDASGCRQTLPILLAMSAAAEAGRAEYTENGNGSGRRVENVSELVRRWNGVERAHEHAQRFCDRAAERLGELSPADPAAFDLLRELPAYLVGRMY